MPEEQGIPGEVGRAADRLSQALDMAADLFASRFRAPASVKLESGNRYSYKRIGQNWSFCHGTEENEIKAAPLGLRMELALNLPRLWKACDRAAADQLEQLEETTEAVLQFVAGHQSPGKGRKEEPQ